MSDGKLDVEESQVSCTVNNEFIERFDVFSDELQRIWKKEEEIGGQLTHVSDCEEIGFQMVCGKKEKTVANVIAGSARNTSMCDVKLAERGNKLFAKDKVPFHVPFIKKPQEKYNVFANQPFEHVWFESSEDGLRFMHPPVMDKNIEPILERKYMYLCTKDGEALKENSLQVERDITSLIKVAVKFASCSSSVVEESLVDEYISDDNDEIVQLHRNKTFMIMPRRSLILDMLSPELRLLLKTEVTTTITTECAEMVLGERFKFLLETKPISFLRLCDSSGHLFVFWRTESLARNYLLSTDQSNRLRAALGYIRDQKMHNLCWAYVITDLISASRVLHGCDEVFTPLCTHYLCQNVMADRFNRTLKDEDKGHRCYSYELELGLLYVKMHGIPKEICGHRVFDCNQNRPTVKDEEMFNVKDIYKYHTLWQALIRLKSHPVGASLLIFEGWEDKREIYRGPLKKGAKYIMSHGVIIVDCKEIDGEMVAVCKSSNGTNIGYDGYIYVSLEVMVICAGAVRRKAKPGSLLCHISPQHLLRDFFSVDMIMGPYPTNIHEYRDAPINKFFKVDSNYDAEIARRKREQNLRISADLKVS